ncbi:hypothetical protein UO65_4823 [Actinokineospora spheciospongiae]|uniref:Uncharacterized protein n=1 Tax=Actinokineospora spheciospongiae TaxID=909613 RepID=W7IFY7_9PSEU|nr:hypothetical protein UO65_4823 [Actinokineospora spheciospongiae]
MVHAWPGHSGWSTMTNGAADSLIRVDWDPSTGYRLLVANVNGSGHWCTSYLPSRGWNNWFKC